MRYIQLARHRVMTFLPVTARQVNGVTSGLATAVRAAIDKSAIRDAVVIISLMTRMFQLTRETRKDTAGVAHAGVPC